MKYLTATYLKDIEKYRLTILHKDNYCLCIKKVIKIKEPFILNEDDTKITIIDNDYYIVEYMPYKENYICRIHIDNKLNVIERFYIATKNNCMKNGIPSFDDLKLSYVCVSKNNIEKFYNIERAKKILSDNEYQLAIKEMQKIRKEIKDNDNFIYNLDYRKYLI